jgi:hypothetical protein
MSYFIFFSVFLIFNFINMFLIKKFNIIERFRNLNLILKMILITFFFVCLPFIFCVILLHGFNLETAILKNKILIIFITIATIFFIDNKFNFYIFKHDK